MIFSFINSLRSFFTIMFMLSGLLNLCISSSLVCLILLGACLLVFWAGLAKKQVPPVLVVSVIFVLSGYNYNLFQLRAFFDIQNTYDSFSFIQHYLQYSPCISCKWNVIQFSMYPFSMVTLQKFGKNLGMNSKTKCTKCGKSFDILFYLFRIFKTSWSYNLGWLGVVGCFLSSISVYVLTRIMRSTLPYLV